MRRVIKIGGSLLTRVGLPDSFARWIDQQAAAENLVVVGGGDLIDAIRTIDKVRPGSPVETHWRCVDLLDVTFQIASCWFDWQLVGTSDQLQERLKSGFDQTRTTLIAVKSFYDRNTNIDVPLDWRTTSDSIAAILAHWVKANELVLLKSCQIDPHANIDSLVSHGIVDEALPRLVNGIPSLRIEQLL